MLKQFRSFEGLVIFGLYFLPIVLWSIFSFSRMNHASHWTLFSLGLTLASFGGLAILMLTRKESKKTPVIKEAKAPEPVKEVVVAPVEPPPPQTIYVVDESLKVEMEKLEQQIEFLKQSFGEEIKVKDQDFEQLRKEKNLQEQENLEAKEKIKELELKVDELNYEIKALIDFNHEFSEEENFTLNENDATRILKKWLEAGNSMSKLSSLENETPEETFSRRIQAEPSALVFLYHPKKEQLISANGHTLTLFGLSPEQFAKQFHTYLPKESLEWHEARSKLAQSKWAAVKIRECHAVLGSLSSGPLEGALVGIAY